jgi:hypothetical protein
LLLLRDSDQHRYGKLVQELANNFKAHKLMLHDDRRHDNSTPAGAHGHPGVAFNMVTQAGGGTVFQQRIMQQYR